MNTFLTTLIVGVSLSMDAFSLALIYGTTDISYKDKIKLSIIVGIYHFVMPLIGLFFGSLLTKYILFNIDYIVAIIFGLIGLEMIISSIRNKEEKIYLGLVGYLIFGFSVSIDSLTTGIGLNVINSNYLEVAFIFAVVSSLFTFMGLKLGNKLSDRFGKCSTIVGGIILILLGIYYVIK